jgi:hypothetical protein
VFRKGCSVATIGIFLASIIAVVTPAAAVVPAPANYLRSEYAWLKEDGVAPETWAQYNNTGWNSLDLSYRFSKVNIAYVVASATSPEDFNVTFIVYHNGTTNYFNDTGHIFGPDSTDPAFLVLNRSVRSISAYTAGTSTYYLFITTFDPTGNPGWYQVRINGTTPVTGSSHTDPDGNPNVQWMFFHVPTKVADLTVIDQLGRSQPFFLDGDSPTTLFNATMVVDPPGNSTGASTAQVQWLTPGNVQIGPTFSVPIYYVPGQGWAAQMSTAANTSKFPFNATHPYHVRITMGYFVSAADFFVLSSLWITVDIDVTPIKGQWFDPSSFLVTYTAIVNTGVSNNPYAEVHNLTLQFWDKVHYDTSSPSDGVPDWVNANPVFANLSWNITGYPVISGSSYTYTYQKMIPDTYIDNSTTSLAEFFGWYSIKSHDGMGIRPAVMDEEQFYVDDPIEGYTSKVQASTTAVWVFEQKPSDIWANAEFDPIFANGRSRQHDNVPYTDKNCNITWYYNDYYDSLYVKPPGNDHQVMSASASWPSEQEWAFSEADINSSFADDPWIGPLPQGFDIVVNATTDTGYIVRELIEYTIVYRALYLEIETPWDEYEPCMKKSVIGKTYYYDEFDNEVPVEWGFYVFKLVDPRGVVYSEPLGPSHWLFESWFWEGGFNPFPWTHTNLSVDSTEALGAVWDELPSDAMLGTWTVYAMVIGTDWRRTDAQTVYAAPFSFQGPVTTTFEIVGQDLHLTFNDILDTMDDSFNATWEVLADILDNQDDLMAMIEELSDEDIAEVMTKLGEIMDQLLAMDADVMAKLDSIDDYVREIRALAQRLDRWRTDLAEDLVDHFEDVVEEVISVNQKIDARWEDLGTMWDVTFWKTTRDPRALAYRIETAKKDIITEVLSSLDFMVAKMDNVNDGLAGRITNVLNAISSEVGGLDASIRDEIKANIALTISSIREKVDQSTAVLGGQISAAADGLHGKFAGVISEIGYVSDKIDRVNEKVVGVEQNVNDKVDAVDASMSTQLLVAIILIVIVLILVLLPIVAPGFRMKE